MQKHARPNFSNSLQLFQPRRLRRDQFVRISQIVLPSSMACGCGSRARAAFESELSPSARGTDSPSVADPCGWWALLPCCCCCVPPFALSRAAAHSRFCCWYSSLLNSQIGSPLSACPITFSGDALPVDRIPGILPYEKSRLTPRLSDDFSSVDNAAVRAARGNAALLRPKCWLPSEGLPP